MNATNIYDEVNERNVILCKELAPFMMCLHDNSFE